MQFILGSASMRLLLNFTCPDICSLSKSLFLSSFPKTRTNTTSRLLLKKKKFYVYDKSFQSGLKFLLLLFGRKKKNSENLWSTDRLWNWFVQPQMWLELLVTVKYMKMCFWQRKSYFNACFCAPFCFRMDDIETLVFILLKFIVEPR